MDDRMKSELVASSQYTLSLFPVWSTFNPELYFCNPPAFHRLYWYRGIGKYSQEKEMQILNRK